MQPARPKKMRSIGRDGRRNAERRWPKVLEQPRMADMGHGLKPFVKRQKNDMADAKAICEAAQRPTMRFVALKSANQQAAAVVFRTRDLLVRQRTQAINALRGHLTEFGVIAAKGPVHTSKLIAALEDPA